VQLNKEKIKGKTSKILEVVLEEKRREINHYHFQRSWFFKVK
jgi:hypothetical protein